MITNCIELIIHKSLLPSIFCVDNEGYDIFELWTLSGKLFLLLIKIILARQSARQLGLGPWVSYPTAESFGLDSTSGTLLPGFSAHFSLF